MILLDQDDVPADVVELQIAQIVTVEAHDAIVWVQQPRGQVEDLLVGASVAAVAGENQTLTEDCPVCCRPQVISVTIDPNEVETHVRRLRSVSVTPVNARSHSVSHAVTPA